MPLLNLQSCTFSVSLQIYSLAIENLQLECWRRQSYKYSMFKTCALDPKQYILQIVWLIFTTNGIHFRFLSGAFQKVYYLLFWKEQHGLYKVYRNRHFWFWLQLDAPQSFFEQARELKVGFQIKASHDNLFGATVEERRSFHLPSQERMLSGTSTTARQKQTLNKIMYVTTACYVRRLWIRQFL